MKKENQTLPASPSALKSYLLASRPKTWVASLSPVLIGTVMAPQLNIPIFVLTSLFSLLIQIGTNFGNDYFDFINGADKNRKGPKRATQEGWIAPQSMLMATLVTFAAALFIAIPLMVQAGLWSLFLALACVTFGLLYTGGPKPLGYMGLGELLVFLFFGPVAAAGSYFLQTGTVTLPVFIASLAPGLISCSILIANNLRDEESDRAAHKKTLIVRFGPLFGVIEYALSLFFAASIPLLLVLFFEASSWILLASLILPLSLPFYSDLKAPSLLPKTAALQLIYTLFFCIGW